MVTGALRLGRQAVGALASAGSASLAVADAAPVAEPLNAVSPELETGSLGALAEPLVGAVEGPGPETDPEAVSVLEVEPVEAVDPVDPLVLVEPSTAVDPLLGCPVTVDPVEPLESVAPEMDPDVDPSTAPEVDPEVEPEMDPEPVSEPLPELGSVGTGDGAGEGDAAGGAAGSGVEPVVAPSLGVLGSADPPEVLPGSALGSPPGGGALSTGGAADGSVAGEPVEPSPSVPPEGPTTGEGAAVEAWPPWVSPSWAATALNLACRPASGPLGRSRTCCFAVP